MNLRIIVVAVSALGFISPCLAQNPAFSSNVMATAEIRVEEIDDGLYVLFGVGGNIAASIGEQGVLIVDTQFTQIAYRYQTQSQTQIPCRR